jgi:ribosomal protein S18 acetylase RimI-like enzyme
MFTYRSFRNTDPPLLVDIWRSRAGQRGLLQPVSADLFEQFVFAKLYFDYQGLILAFDGDRAVGFAHAGFGPDDGRPVVSTQFGVTCLVLTRPDCSNPAEVASGLLAACEDYLRGRGAQVLYGGGLSPLNPFYLGLYGGSELPGILQSDTIAVELFRAHNYREIDQTQILDRNLQGFQAPISRQQLQLRRQMALEVLVDAPTCSWWQASTSGDFDLTRFDVHPRGGGTVIASATFRNMDPSGACGFIRAAGLMDVWVETSHLRQGLATYLLAEAFQHFLRQGITVVEAQTMQRNTAARGLYQKLGFVQVDQGLVFRKESA